MGRVRISAPRHMPLDTVRIFLHRRFAQDDKTDGYRIDGPVSVAKFEIGEAAEPKQREARVLCQRQVSDVIEQLLARIGG